MKAYHLERGAAPLDGECPLCGCRIEAPESVVECPGCHTSYHLDCWRFCGDKCGRLGCAGEAEITGVVPLPKAAVGPSRLPPLLRISLGEAPRSANQAPHPFPWVWRGTVRSALFAVVMSFLAVKFYDLVTDQLRRSLGEQGLSRHFALPFLSSIGTWATSHWALGGLLYGVLHHRHLTLHTTPWQNATRVVLSALYLGPLSFELGHLAFAPAHWVPDIFWGLPSKVLWLSPVAAWAALVFAILAILGTYRTRISLFFLTFGMTVLAVAVAMPAYIGMTSSGLIFGGLFWLAGAAVDLVWRGHHFASSFASWGQTFGGSIGFATGAVSSISKIARNSTS